VPERQQNVFPGERAGFSGAGRRSINMERLVQGAKNLNASLTFL